MQRCLCSTYNTCFTSNSCDINNTWKHSTHISNAQSKVKVKVAIPHEEYSWRAHFNSLCHKPSKSMTHDQYDTRPMLTFPATGHLPSDQYQIILLGDKGTSVQTTYSRLLPNSGMTGSQVHTPNHYNSRTHNAHTADSKYTHTSTILFSDQSSATANEHTIILLEWKLSHKTHRLKLVHFLQILTTSVCTVKWKQIKLSTITYYAVYWRTHVVSLWDSSLNCLNPGLALFLRVGLQHVTSATQTSTNSTCLLVF